jgi:phosphoribosyl-ATP pyrophosphohydrolase
MTETITPLGDTDGLAAALAHLAETIDARSGADPASSWTAKLLAAGPQLCAKKLGEEAVETALALVSGSQADITAEAADLLYHLMVALRSRGVPLSDIAAKLEARQGTSGLAEKAARPKT